MVFAVKTIEPGGPIKNKRGRGVTHGTHKPFGGGCRGSYPYRRSKVPKHIKILSLHVHFFSQMFVQEFDMAINATWGLKS